MPYLVHKHHDGSVIQFWNLHEGPIVVGRGADIQAPVEDPKLSRQQFSIAPNAGGFVVKDLAGKSSTLVNGVSVTEKVLVANDKINAGDSTFYFVDGLTTMAGKIDKDLQDLDRLTDKPGT